MAVNASQQAVAAKVRSRYGRFFTKEDYASFAASGGVPELLGALREQPDYAAVLSDSGTLLHRGNLEQLLTYHYYEDLGSLFRFDRFLGSPLYTIAAGRLTVDLLLAFARRYNAGTLSQFAPMLPAFFRQHLSPDLTALTQARSLAELLQIMAGHPFLPALAENLPPAGEPVHLSRLEFSLLHHYYHQVDALFAQDPKQYAGGREIFGVLIDLENLQRLLRAKRNFPDTDPSRLLFDLGHFTARQRKELADMTVEQVTDFIRQSRYGAYLRGDLPADVALQRMVYDHCRKVIRFQVEAPCLLMAYMILSRIRLDCLITIVEGIRYGMPPDAITALLPLESPA